MGISVTKENFHCVAVYINYEVYKQQLFSMGRVIASVFGWGELLRAVPIPKHTIKIFRILLFQFNININFKILKEDKNKTDGIFIPSVFIIYICLRKFCYNTFLSVIHFDKRIYRFFVYIYPFDVCTECF